MPLLSFYSWLEKVDMYYEDYYLFDQIKHWDSDRLLCVGYKDDYNSIHLYYKGFAILHLSFKDSTYLINRLTNSANRRCSKVVKLKIAKQINDLYESIYTHESSEILSAFYAKRLSRYEVPSLVHFIKIMIKKVDSYYIKADEKYKIEESEYKEPLGAVEIRLDDDFCVTEMSSMLEDLNDLYIGANDILKIINFFQYKSDLGYNIHKEVAAAFDLGIPEIDLKLLQINMASDGSILLGAASSIVSIIKDIVEISNINEERELNKVRRENEVDNKIFETKQKYVKLLQQIDECNHPAGKAMLQHELNRCLDIIKKYDGSFQKINCRV